MSHAVSRLTTETTMDAQDVAGFPGRCEAADIRFSVEPAVSWGGKLPALPDARGCMSDEFSIGEPKIIIANVLTLRDDQIDWQRLLPKRSCMRWIFGDFRIVPNERDIIP